MSPVRVRPSALRRGRAVGATAPDAVPPGRSLTATVADDHIAVPLQECRNHDAPVDPWNDGPPPRTMAWCGVNPDPAVAQREAGESSGGRAPAGN
jgi:hypothetical protein